MKVIHIFVCGLFQFFFSHSGAEIFGEQTSVVVSDRNDRSLRQNFDAILEWNAITLEAVIYDHHGPEVPGDKLSCTQGPPGSAMQLAIVHLAMFDAYNSCDHKFVPYLVDIKRGRKASAHAAVAQAAHDMLVAGYPDQSKYLGRSLHKSLSQIPKGKAKNQGIWVGKEVAKVILDSRANDGSCDYTKYEYKLHQPGQHQDDPASPGQVAISPHFGKVKPIVVPDISGFKGPPPPPLNSTEYAIAYNQVKKLGGDGVTTHTTRGIDGTIIAWYHSYNGSPKIGTPPSMVNEVARVIAIKKGNTMAENARLFALVNAALGDSAIAAWKAKFDYNLWRPVVGIRYGDKDGNVLTEKDEHWKYLGASRSNPYPGEKNFVPAFPAYTSGHATFCGAGIKALINFYYENKIPFEFVSKEWDGISTDTLGRARPKIVQKFKKLSHFASQCAASRVFNGVHWNFDGTAGIYQGNKVADYIFENSMKPLKGPLPHAVPNVDVNREVASYLDGSLKSIFYLPNGGDVEEAVLKYLNSPAVPPYGDGGEGGSDQKAKAKRKGKGRGRGKRKKAKNSTKSAKRSTSTSGGKSK